MKYYIQRELSEYGPYTLADLQRYVALGNVKLTDLTRSEGMSDWVPVSQVLGNIPIDANPPMPVQGSVYSGGTVYSGAATAPALATGVPINPPNFHWVAVLVLGLLTRGLFLDIWLIVQASWLRKATNVTKNIYLAASALGSLIVGLAVIVAADGTENNPALMLGFLLLLGSIVLRLVAAFSMRSSIEDYYNTVEPMNLSLSGVMTFFFSATYFQYHFNKINSWKKTATLAIGR